MNTDVNKYIRLVYLKIKAIKCQLTETIHQLLNYAKKIRKLQLKPLTGLSLVGVITIAIISLIVVQIASGQQSVVNRIVLTHNNRERIVISSATTVAEVLHEQDIVIQPEDIVNPGLETAIDEDDFNIDVHQAYEVKIIDGDQVAIGQTIHYQPQQIVEDLNYQLDVNDQAIWGGYELTEEGVEIRTIRIIRMNTYILNINGQEVTKTSAHNRVDKILQSTGYDLDNIAYIKPHLKTIITPNDVISVYYQRPNQVLETDIVVSINNGVQTETEVLYQVLLDPHTQTEITRHVIEEVVIDNRSLSAINQRDYQYGELTDQKRRWLNMAGIDESDWYYVDFIIFRESNWRHWIWNSQGSSAYGLCQALPAHKMISAGDDYMTNPITQLKWCHSYALERYGSWADAYNFWQVNYWW